MLYKCYTNVIQLLYTCYKSAVQVLYSVHLFCRIDSSGIAANTHRHLLACEADRKTKRTRASTRTRARANSISVTIVSRHHRHCREPSSAALPRSPSAASSANACARVQTSSSGIAAGRYGHGQAATFYYPFAQSGRRQVDARSAELGLLARPQATAKASGGGAKRLEVRRGRKARAPRWRTQARRRR